MPDRTLDARTERSNLIHVNFLVITAVVSVLIKLDVIVHALVAIPVLLVNNRSSCICAGENLTCLFR